jgi:dimethylargininase
MPRIALTRQISPRIGDCLLTHLDREPIDVQRAMAQHQQYEQCLESLGIQVRRLPEMPDLPDSVFVEDTAVVFDELAIITRPGNPARCAETTSMAQVLTQYRTLKRIEPPGTLDGGDVLVVDRRVFVGLSSRSNQAGVDQMREILSAFDYQLVSVPVQGCLHLKSAVTQVAENTLLINRAWVDEKLFLPLKVIDVDPSEPMAANVLLVDDTVVYADHFPATQARLTSLGLSVHTLDMTELAKAEGAVTCCSVLLDT